MNSPMKNTMTSREIADYTGKQHKDVLEAIRAMEPAWLKVNGRKFPLVEYTDAKGEKRPMYELTKTECLYIATKFNDEARARLILRWEDLERNRINLDSISRKDIARMLLEAEERKEALEAENQKQLLALKVAAPKVLFADCVTASESSILIGELAKILKQNGIEIGQNRLFEWLRSNGYLCSRGESYNLPTQRAMELGLFEIKKTTISPPGGPVFVSETTKVTPKGQIYFVNKFLTAA